MTLQERIHNLPHLVRLRGHYGIKTKEAEEEVLKLVDESIREENEKCADLADIWDPAAANNIRQRMHFIRDKRDSE